MAMYYWLAMVVALCFPGVGFRNGFGGGYSVIVQYTCPSMQIWGSTTSYKLDEPGLTGSSKKKRHDNWKIWRKNRDPKISKGYEHESKAITTQYVIKLVLYDHQTSGRGSGFIIEIPSFLGGDESSWGENMNRGWDYTKKNTSTIINCHQPSGMFFTAHSTFINIYIFINLKRSPKLRCLCWSTAWSQVALPIPTCHHSTIENIEFGCGVETDAKWTHEW